jgi:hypothetical protein
VWATNYDLTVPRTKSPKGIKQIEAITRRKKMSATGIGEPLADDENTRMGIGPMSNIL